MIQLTKPTISSTETYAGSGLHELDIQDNYSTPPTTEYVEENETTITESSTQNTQVTISDNSEQTNHTLEIQNSIKYITNNTKKIGISLENKGTFQKKHNYATFIIPQYLGKYKKQIEKLLQMTHETISDTTSTLQKLKHHFRHTEFQGITRNMREKICSDPNTTTISPPIANLTTLCNKYAFNTILKKALFTNTEVHRTTIIRITKLQTKMQNIMHTFTISENRKKREDSPLSFVGKFERWLFDMATGEDVRYINRAINQIERSQGTITSTLNSVVIFNDWTKKHLTNVEQAVRQLQKIITNLGKTLKNKMLAINTENNPKFILNIASVTMTTNAFLSINNIATTLEQEIQRLANSIEQSINGNLNTDTITPNKLLKSITEHKINLKATEKLLWQDEEDIIKIYKHAEVNIYRCSTGQQLIITFKIPVIDESTNIPITEINILPFTATRNAQNELIVNLDKNINQINIIQMDNQIYEINKEDIAEKETDTYNKNSLKRIKKEHRKCISNILTQNTTKILENCGTRINDQPFIITQTNTSKYNFYSRGTTIIELQCPVINKEKRIEVYTERLTGYGTLTTPEYCSLRTPEITFLGKNIELASILVEQKQFELTTLITYDELNTELWRTIISNHNELQRKDLLNLIEQIEEIEPINGTEYNTATTKLREEIMHKIQLAEEHLSNARELLKFLNSEFSPTIGSIIILATIIILMITYFCIKINKSKTFRKLSKPKYPIIKTNDKDGTPLLRLNSRTNKRVHDRMTKAIPW